MSIKYPNFFPIPLSLTEVWVATEEVDRLGRPINKRDVEAWNKEAEERNKNIKVAQIWRDAALQDGWTMSPTYAHEDVNRMADLHLALPAVEAGAPPLQYRAMVQSRPNEGDPADQNARDVSMGNGDINVWGPDGLTIPVPLIYPGQQYFKDALVTCPHCHRGPNGRYFASCATEAEEWPAHLLTPVATFRYSFAGRTCKECAPALIAIHEKPGWND